MLDSPRLMKDSANSLAIGLASKFRSSSRLQSQTTCLRISDNLPEDIGMPPKNVDVTETELAILDVLWECGPTTIRDITDRLYERGTAGEYATVQKLLDRLTKKGHVRRDRKSFAHSFSATVERDQLIGQGLENLAEQLCDGSFTPLLMHLADATKLSKKDRVALQQMVEDAEKRVKKPGSKR